MKDDNPRIERKEYPILEFDPDRASITVPETSSDPFKVPENCVLCFFNDVLQKFYRKGLTKTIGDVRCGIGSFPIYQSEFNGKKIAMFHPGIGAPLAAALLEEIISHGARKFIACGGAGVLDRKIPVGHLLIPTSAVRDEGTSYHYLPPGREIRASSPAIVALTETLTHHRVKYLLTKTWTTAAFYRETKEKIRLRQSEGCMTVEMEASALFAVAEFRGVPLAEVLYAGDDVSGDIWDVRASRQRNIVREDVLNLSIEACSML